MKSKKWPVILLVLVILFVAGKMMQSKSNVEDGTAKVESLEILDNKEIEAKVGDKITFKVKATPSDFSMKDIKLEAMHPEMVKFGELKRIKDGFTFEVEFIEKGKTGIKILTDYLDFIISKGITVYPR